MRSHLGKSSAPTLNDRGYTLIELAVVVAVLGIIAAGVIVVLHWAGVDRGDIPAWVSPALSLASATAAIGASLLARKARWSSRR